MSNKHLVTSKFLQQVVFFLNLEIGFNITLIKGTVTQNNLFL